MIEAITNLNPIIAIVLLTFLPLLELRASIPYGIFGTELHFMLVFFVAVVSNIILAPLVYLFLDKIIYLFLKIKVINRCYQVYVEKTQKKIQKYVDKYGEIGLAVFIGIPLPGSGVYSGALAAYLIGMDYKKFIKATIIGVLMAGIIVTIVSLAGGEAFRIFIKL